VITMNKSATESNDMKEFDEVVINIYGSFISKPASSHDNIHPSQLLLIQLLSITEDHLGGQDSNIFKQVQSMSSSLTNVFNFISEKNEDDEEKKATNTFHEIVEKYSTTYNSIAHFLATKILQSTDGEDDFLHRLTNARFRSSIVITDNEKEQMLVAMLDPFSALSSHTTWMESLNNNIHHVVAIRCLLAHCYAHREYLVRKYSYSVPDPLVLKRVCTMKLKTIISLGCGKAYWSHLLRETRALMIGGGSGSTSDMLVVPADVQVHNNLATDGHANYCSDVVQVEPMDQSILWNTVKDDQSEETALLLCWVPKINNEGFIHAIQTFPGRHLIIVGESSGGSCGSTQFWNVVNDLYLEEDYTILPRFLGWYDGVLFMIKR
jgi:hypothetical protein